MTGSRLGGHTWKPFFGSDYLISQAAPPWSLGGSAMCCMLDFSLVWHSFTWGDWNALMRALLAGHAHDNYRNTVD